jgi:hypothetical protein
MAQARIIAVCYSLVVVLGYNHLVQGTFTSGFVHPFHSHHPSEQPLKLPQQFPKRRSRIIHDNRFPIYDANGSTETHQTDSHTFNLNPVLQIAQNDSETQTAQFQSSLDQGSNNSCVQRRQFLLASVLLAATPLSSNAINQPQQKQQLLTTKTNYEKSPINKRSGITLSSPEKIYPLNFITYLSRFLLVNDEECQQWWYTQATVIPPKAPKEEVDRLRLDQFGRFAASVEVGLLEYEGENGVAALLDDLVRRYADISMETPSVGERKDPFYSLGESTQQQQQKVRKKKEALRQIALMFSLLKEYQPVGLITQLLAADDDAKIDKVIITDGGAGYLPPEYNSAKVSFPDPPTLGTVFGGSVATGNVILKESGGVLKIDLLDGGSGYVKPPSVEISLPSSISGTESFRATAKAILGKGKTKGSIERIEIINHGAGYNSTTDLEVTITPPESPEGKAATAKAILEYQVAGVEITDPGRGYAAERPIRVVIDPPESGGIGRPAAAISYPRGRSTSYKSFLSGENEGDAWSASDTSSNWVLGPTSSQLLTLLPSGYGLKYDPSLKRYVLTAASSDEFDDNLFGTLEGMSFKPINPIFGIRGRSPIEREKSLDTSTVLRFMASGAVCSSVAHLILTPIDVVKTKVQTRPEIYNEGIVRTFKKVLREEGASTFFDGWEPTFVGFFFTGGIAFFLTEFFRRYYTSLAVSTMMAQSALTEVAATATVTSFEIPLIAASAATSGFCCCFLLAPFDAVRIRTVSDPGYADNIAGVVARMVKEEGFLSLFSAVNAWFLKEVPYNVVSSEMDYVGHKSYQV